LFFCNGDKEKCGDGNTNLRFDGIETVTPKDLDFEMLLDPFEK